MATQIITGNETGNEFVEKLNNNFSQGSNVHPFLVKMERGGLKSSGAMDYTISSYNNYIRSSMLISTNDATKVVGKTLTGFTVYEYSSSFTKIKTSTPGDTFDSNTRYIKITKQTNDIVENAVLLFDGDVEEVYNVQIESGMSGGHLLSEMLVFEVDENICTTARLLLPSLYSISGKKVPLILWNPCDGSFITWGEYIDTVGSRGPITTQLQYLASQGFAVLEVFLWGSYNYTHNIDQSLGYNVCGKGSAPVPVALRAMEKAVEYVTTRFNISDTNIFEASWSGGGKLSAYYAIHKAGFNLRHIYAISPVVDGGVWRLGESLGGATGYKAAVNSEMKFEGTTTQINDYLNGTYTGASTDEEKIAAALAFRMLNAEKFMKYLVVSSQNLVGSYMKDGVLHQHNIEDKMRDSLYWGEAWRNAINYDGNPKTSYTGWSALRGTMYDRYELSITSDGSPITIVGSEDDSSCPYLAMEQFIIQLRNGGAEAKIIALPSTSSSEYGNGHNNGYGHSAPVYDNQIDGIPYFWWYMVQDIKSRYLKTT